MIARVGRACSLREDIRRLAAAQEIELIEHAVRAELRVHGAWLTVPDFTVMRRLVIEHPVACGCDALPDHVLVEG